MNTLPPEPSSNRPITQSTQRWVSWRMAWTVAVLLGAVALASCVLAWRTNHRVSVLEQELVRRQQDSTAQSSEARLLAKQAREGMSESVGKVALLEARVAEVVVQRSQLEELIQSLSRSRDENLLADVEAAIRVALQQTAITGSAEPLVTALKKTDERLVRHNQPRLEGVRRAIARDLDRVKAAALADVSSLSFQLDEAIRLVDELPLVATVGARQREPQSSLNASMPDVASSVPARTAASAWTDHAHKAWSLFNQHVWGELKSLVRVTQITHPDAMLLAPEQSFFLKENLKLRLLNARLALLSRQYATAQADLKSAQFALERYFDRNAKRTQLTVDLVRQVAAQARQVSVPRPDDTLAALTAVTGL
jgi:uroporphyrin-III C-methyltransferase